MCLQKPLIPETQLQWPFLILLLSSSSSSTLYGTLFKDVWGMHNPWIITVWGVRTSSTLKMCWKEIEPLKIKGFRTMLLWEQFCTKLIHLIYFQAGSNQPYYYVCQKILIQTIFEHPGNPFAALFFYLYEVISFILKRQTKIVSNINCGKTSFNVHWIIWKW